MPKPSFHRLGESTDGLGQVRRDLSLHPYPRPDSRDVPPCTIRVYIYDSAPMEDIVLRQDLAMHALSPENHEKSVQALAFYRER